MDLRTKFTKWYYRKGYRMSPVFPAYGVGHIELIFVCPWWVKPLTWWLFSPSVYYAEQTHQFGDIVERRIEELMEKGVV